MAAAVRKRQVHFMRDRFFLSLARTWQSHLGLRLAVSADRPYIAFIRAASQGVLDKPRQRHNFQTLFAGDSASWAGAGPIRHVKIAVENSINLILGARNFYEFLSVTSNPG